MARVTYMGPYDFVYPDGLDGPVIKKGDKVTLSKEKREELGPRHQWSDDDPDDPAIPTMADASEIQTPVVKDT